MKNGKLYFIQQATSDGDIYVIMVENLGLRYPLEQTLLEELKECKDGHLYEPVINRGDWDYDPSDHMDIIGDKFILESDLLKKKMTSSELPTLYAVFFFEVRRKKERNAKRIL